MKNKGNKCIFPNYIQVNLPQICETEILSQDEFKIVFVIMDYFVDSFKTLCTIHIQNYQQKYPQKIYQLKS